MICADQVEIDWPFSSARSCTVLSRDILILKNPPNQAERAMVLGRLTSTQFARLFEGARSQATLRVRRSIGKRLNRESAPVLEAAKSLNQSGLFRWFMGAQYKKFCAMTRAEKILALAKEGSGF